jgi:acyl transferase domain-containing protein/acyl carrier protein
LKLEEKLMLNDDRREPIAVVGMGCRFPGGAHDPQSYWQLLLRGGDAMVEVPADRWDLKRFYDPDPDKIGKMSVKRAGFLQAPIDEFDSQFFGISPREAATLDPQQRLLLEITWEALEDAGLDPQALRGSNTGVYVGGFTLDNKVNQLGVLNRENIGTHTAASSTMVMLSNRVSYAYDFRGPSMSVDTACSSSLVSLHMAAQGLWTGDCDMAVSGGVSLILRPEYFIAMCKGGFLAPDGHCKTFDEKADGYARGEGAGVVVLKRLSDALAAGDPIHALVPATGVNQDGRTPGITVPSGEAQEQLMRQVVRRAGITPSQISVVEAHGTGTRAGDPVEARSLSAVLAEGRPEGDKAWVGSVKTNIGHLEAGAGIAAVIKTILTLEHRVVPPHLHLDRPNPEIDFDALPLRVPQKPEPLPGGADEPLYACINSFGYGGTNGHVIIQSAPPARPAAPPEVAASPAAGDADRPWVVPLSASSADSLQARAGQQAQLLADLPEERLADWAHTLATRRAHLDQRLLLTGSGLKQLRQRLQAVAAGEVAEGTVVGRSSKRRPLVFVYTGMGPQWFGMGRQLMRDEPLFARTLEECDAIWRPLAGWSLKERLFGSETGDPMPDPADAQPANFALQAALTRVWEQYGVRADAMVGHSVGEIAAAWAAGVLSLEHALKLTYHRSQLQQRTVGQGTMLSVGKSVEEARPLMEAFPGKLSVAAINAPSSCALAGDQEALQKIADELTAEGVFARFLRVSVAYHSHQFDPLEADFMRLLADLSPRAPRLPLYSTVTGALVDGAQQDTAYWWRNARDSVLLQDALLQIIDDGHDAFLELGPNPVLAASIRECLSSNGSDGVSAASMRRKQQEQATLLSNLGTLYTSGVELSWQRLHPAGELLPLPAYPWDRDRVWLESEASLYDRVGKHDHPLLTFRPDQTLPTWDGELSEHWLPYLSDHKVEGTVIFPGAGYVELGLVAAARLNDREGAGLVVDELSFSRPLTVPQTPQIRLRLDPESNRFQIHSRPPDQWDGWTLHASGKLLLEQPGRRQVTLPLEQIRGRMGQETDSEALYRMLDERGLQYGPMFRGVQRIWAGDGEVLAEIAAHADVEPTLGDYLLHPTLLDACFQSLIAAIEGDDRHAGATFMPVTIRQLRLHGRPSGKLLCHGRITRRTWRAVEGDIVLADADGRVLVEAFGLRLQALGATRAEAGDPQRLQHGLRWEPSDEKPERARIPEEGATWLVLGDRGGAGAALCDELASFGYDTELVLAGGDGGRRALDPDSPEDFRGLLATVEPGKLAGVAYLWALDRDAESDAGNGRLATGEQDCAAVLHLTQALDAARVKDIRLALVTAGAEQVSDSDPAAGSPAQGALWGLGRVIDSEHPALGPRLIDLDPADRAGSLDALAEELCGRSAEPEVALRGAKRYVHRMTRLSDDDDGAFFTSGPDTAYILRIPRPGTIDNLEYQELARREPGPGEVELEVRVGAINFKDLMKVMNLLPDEYLENTFFGQELGVECAGVVTRVGPDVTQFSPGDEVVSPDGEGTFRTFNTVPTRYMVPRPAPMSFEQSVQFINYITPYYGLVEVARLSEGETVLIHGAAGGVGLAAVRIAQLRGARVMATAGSEKKRAFLREQGVELVSDSRSLAFYDDVMRWTDGRGVDVVLNSLYGELLAKSFELLAPYGRFIEIGKRDINENSKLAMAAFSRNLTFAAVDIDVMMADHPQLFRRMLDEVWALLDDGSLAPLPTKAFPAAEVGDAFRYLAQSRHIGKVVVQMHDQRVPVRALPRQLTIQPDATYVVSGGLGGFGFEVTRWLAGQGARHLAVLSRSGARSVEARLFVSEFEKAGGKLLAPEIDVADSAAVSALFQRLGREMPPVRGIVHSAAVLDDAVLAQMDSARLGRVMGPKARGAWNLHQATASEGAELDFFVCFSSISSLIGNAGQGNYAAGNGFLDALARYRQARGLPGLTINWGALGEVGMVARDAGVEQHLQRLGIAPVPLGSALRELSRALCGRRAQLGLMDVDWQQFASASPRAARSPRYARLVSAEADGAGGASSELYQALIAADPEQRQTLAETFLVEQIARTLRLSVDKVDAQTGLDRLGVDSLMAVELSNAIRLQVGVEFPTMLMMQGPTISQLASELNKQLITEEDELLAEVDQMSEDQLDALLEQMNP